MFTGIVHSARPINNVQLGTSTGSILIDLGEELCDHLMVGSSVSVDGICLTATKINGTLVSFDIIMGTLGITTLSQYKIGRLVNIERSLSQGEEIGGHEVSGHVDCKGSVHSTELLDGNTYLSIILRPRWVRYLFPHGFIAINGVSLTVSSFDKDKSMFSVWLIPETIRRTNLGKLYTGDLVNIEIHRGMQVLVDTINDAVERVISKAVTDGKLTAEQVNSLLTTTQKLLYDKKYILN